MIQCIVKMEKQQEMWFNFWLGRKMKNMIIVFLTRKRKKREKAKISILIVQKESSEDS